MKRIRERLQTAFLLAIFMPVVLTVITNEEVGEWLMLKWTFVIGVLVLSYLIIEIGSHQIVQGIDKLISAILMIVTGTFAVIFLLVASSEISDPLGIVRQKFLFGSVFLMMASSLSLMVILFVKTAMLLTEKLAGKLFQ